MTRRSHLQYFIFIIHSYWIAILSYNAFIAILSLQVSAIDYFSQEFRTNWVDSEFSFGFCSPEEIRYLWVAPIWEIQFKSDSKKLRHELRSLAMGNQALKQANQDLCQAVQRGDVHSVERLLRQNAQQGGDRSRMDFRIVAGFRSYDSYDFW